MSDAVARSLRRFLLHPLTVLAGIVLGGLWGWMDKGAMPLLVQVGHVYVKLLQMCVIPLLFTAVTISLARLVLSGGAGRYIGRIAAIFVAGLVLAGLLGTVLGELGHPGAELQQQAKTVLGQVIIRAEATQSGLALADRPPAFADLVIGIVPENIFFALTSGNKLAVLFFAILFGIALGVVCRERSDQAIQLFEVFYDAFVRIIAWLMYALPLGLFCLAYAQVSAIGGRRAGGADQAGAARLRRRRRAGACLAGGGLAPHRRGLAGDAGGGARDLLHRLRHRQQLRRRAGGHARAEEPAAGRPRHGRPGDAARHHDEPAGLGLPLRGRLDLSRQPLRARSRRDRSSSS